MLKTKGWKYYFVEREKEGENLYVPSSDRVGSPDFRMFILNLDRNNFIQSLKSL